MANYIRFINKHTNEVEDFLTVDEKIAKHLNCPVDPEHWVYQWYNVIGLMLAYGKPITTIQETLLREEADTELYQIATFIKNNYIVEAWSQRG
jgi:hypothetical protein